MQAKVCINYIFSCSCQSPDYGNNNRSRLKCYFFVFFFLESKKDGIDFGWLPIIDQYQRDQDRVQHNLGRRVPGLGYTVPLKDKRTI